jgi:hypothetical protein
MRKVFIMLFFLMISFLIIRSDFEIFNKPEKETSSEHEKYREISGTIKKGETFFDIFKKYELDIGELFKLREASANIHRLRELYPGQPYKIIIDDNNQINSFIYWINDDSRNPSPDNTRCYRFPCSFCGRRCFQDKAIPQQSRDVAQDGRERQGICKE